jgi:hypothetical protein
MSKSYDLEDWIINNDMEDVKEQIVEVMLDSFEDEEDAESIADDIMLILMKKLQRMGFSDEDELQ